MAEICPDCEIEMKEEHLNKLFGNPIKVEEGILTEVCPKCGFRIVSEENLGAIKRAVNK